MSIGDILAIGVMLFIVLVFATSIMNGIILSFNFRIKLPIPERFKGKMTPIYHLSTFSSKLDDEIIPMYFVTKYELEYADVNDISIKVMLIPFYTLFQSIQYVKKEQFGLGVLTESQVSEINVEDEWNKCYDEMIFNEKIEKAKKQEFKDLLNKANRNFNDNYTE